MKFYGSLLLIFLAVALLPGCAAVKRPAPVARAVPKIRVGLVVKAATITVSGTGMFQIGIKDSDRKPKICAPGERWTFISATGGGESGDTGTGTGEGGQPSTSPAVAGIEVIDPDGLSRGVIDATFAITSLEPETFLTVNGKKYRGSFEIFQSPSRLVTLVNVADVESYLRGVVPNEIGSSSAQILEAVKAQAVAARTYCFFFSGRYSADGFDVLPTVQDQLYTGVDGERPLSDQAIAETYGVVATFDGQPIRANYFSTCGGATAAIEEVWAKEPLPYLRGVEDKEGFGSEPYCCQAPNYRWKETWTAEQFESIFKKNFRVQYPTAAQPSPEERVVDVRVAERSKSGRVKILEIVTPDNIYRIRGDSIRLVIRPANGQSSILRSTLFDVDVQRDQGYATIIAFNGGGNGHGVGMCQMGAMEMAREGKNFHQILTHYYRGIKLSRAY